MVYALLEFLFIDIPDSFVMLWMGLAVFNLTLRQVGKRALYHVMLQAVAAFLLTYYRVPFEAKVIIAVPMIAAIASVTLRFPARLAFLFALATMIPNLVAEAAVILLLKWFSILPHQAVAHFPLQVGFMWMRLLLVLLLVYVLRKNAVDLRPYFPETKQGRYLAALVIVGGFELLLILAAVESATLLRPSAHVLPVAPAFPFLHLTILVLFIALIILFRVYLTAALSRVEAETEQPYLQHIKDLVTTIRSIKHDAVNHYTAIEGFLKLGLRDLAADYIKQLLKESSSFNQMKNVNRPQVSALLHVKLAQCISERIAIKVEIATSSQCSFMPARELVELLAAVMDHAIRATLNEAEENRYIILRWGEDAQGEFLSLEHSGWAEEAGTEHPASEIVKRYGGRLTVEAAGNATRLHLVFPDARQEAKELFQSLTNLDQNSSM